MLCLQLGAVVGVFWGFCYILLNKLLIKSFNLFRNQDIVELVLHRYMVYKQSAGNTRIIYTVVLVYTVFVGTVNRM